MLFTYSPAIAIEDLADYDTGLLDTASTEGINLTVKIRLAINEVGLQLKSQFPPLAAFGVNATSSITLENIVVTASLRLWLVFHTLEIVYRDAYFSQLNDRYLAKWNEYKELSASAAAQLFQIGIGTVADPIPQAAHPGLSLVPGALTPGKYFVQVAWKNASGQEGSPSEVTALEATNGNTLEVQALNPPANAVAWNVYVGVTPDTLYLQNASPLNPASSWIAPNAGLIATGPQPGDGQPPALVSPAPRILLRG